MTTSAARAFQYETDFLSGVEANFETAKGNQLRGTIWQLTRTDESDRLRALLASHRVYDREKLKSLPANRRITLQGFERRFLFGKRPTGVAVATVLSPLGHYASEAAGEASPVGLGELADHVRKLVRQAKAPHLIGVCSPTGFTEEARSARLDLPDVTVVLVEPDGRGGWRTHATGEETDRRVLRIFDPEGTKDKLRRVRSALQERSADLLTGGLSVSSLARALSLPVHLVREGFTQAAAADPELHTAEQKGEFLLFRGAPVRDQEKKPMNVVDRIKQLFSSEGDEVEKINLLSQRRASLAQRRDRIYEDIGKLEHKEADLLAQGKAARSKVPRRRLAAQLAQLRKDIARQNTTASMLNKQIDIISTDIHNLTLLRQGEMASLPNTEELTENAVRAEEMLETLNADSELVGSLETGLEDTLSTEDEVAILREFEEDDVQAPSDDTAKAAPAPSRSAAPETRRPVSSEPTTEEAADADPPAKDRPADAEPL